MEGRQFPLPPLDSPLNFRSEFHITVDVRGGGLPVYFDFEASWSRFSELSGTMAYPRGLAASIDDAATTAFSNRERERIRELVERPFRDGGATGPLRVSPFFLSRAQRNLLEEGVVERRVLLDTTKVQAFRNRRIEQVAFLHGELLPRAKPELLFRRLMAIQLTPFLFVTEGSTVLLGALSAVPPLRTGRNERPAILANLQQFLQGITIARQPLGSLRVPVDHRYDRLLRPN